MKKRLMALLLTTVLCLSMIPSAFAATKEMILEEYSYTGAREVIATEEWEGKTVSLKDMNLKFWVPGELVRMKLPEELVQSGVLAYYKGESLNIVVKHTRYEITSLDDYEQMVTEQKCTNIVRQEINGLDTLCYTSKQSGGRYLRIAVSMDDDGCFLEFVYDGSKKLENMSNVSIATIRPIKK